MSKPVLPKHLWVVVICGRSVVSYAYSLVVHFISFNIRRPPHCARGIWKLGFHSENASYVFLNLKTQQSLIILNLCLWKWHKYRDAIVFENFRFLNVFLPHENKNRSLQFPRFEECLLETLFLWRISMDGRPNRRNNAAFLNFSGVGYTGPYMSIVLYLGVLE